MRIAYPGIAPSLGVREALEDIYLGKWFIPKGSAGEFHSSSLLYSWVRAQEKNVKWGIQRS